MAIKQENDAKQAAIDRPPHRKAGLFGRIFKTIGLALLALVLIIVVIFAFEIPVSLKLLSGPLESLASEALGRRIVIDGPLTIIPSTSPAVEIGGIHIGNPEGWPEADLAALKLARARISVLPLLRGAIIIDEVKVDGLALNLETNAEGEPNWLLGRTKKAPEAEKSTENAEEKPPTGATEKPDSSPSALNKLELRDLSLADIALTHRAAGNDKALEFKIDTVTGSAIGQEPLQLNIDGSLQDAPYSIKLNGDSLAALFEGGKPWSLDMLVEMLGASFKVDGEMADPLRGQGVNIDFDLNTPKIEEIAARFGTELPPVGGFELTGRIEQLEGKFQLTDLRGEMATAELTARFEADFSGEKPFFLGDVALLTIDAGPFIAAAESDIPEADDNQAETKKEEKPVQNDAAEGESKGIDPDQPVLVLDVLNEIDAEFKLSIAEVQNVPVSLRDASFEVTVADGQLKAPMRITVAEVGFNGEASLTPADDGPQVAISLQAGDSDIGDLARMLAGIKGIEGKFNGADLSLTAQGETIRQLSQTAALKFDMAQASLSYGNETGGRPVEFALDSADMDFPAAGDSQINAKGSLLGEAFSVTITGGTFLENIIEKNWPVKLTASGGGAELRLDAKMDTKSGGSVVDFDIGGEQIGGLAKWIGTSPEAQASYHLSGQITLDESGVLTRLRKMQLGATSADGELGFRKENGKRVPFVKLSVDTVDVEELTGLFAKPEQQAGSEEETTKADTETDNAEPADAEGGKALKIDVPILPNGINLIDADIALTVETVKMTPPLSGISVSGEIRDGHIAKAPLAATVDKMPLTGEFSADLRSARPEMDLTIQTGQADIGKLMAELGVASGLRASAGKLDLNLSLRGQSTREILQQSAFSANLHDAVWRLQSGESDGGKVISIPEGSISAEADKPITLKLDGRLDGEPVTINIETESLASFAEAKEKLEMNLNIALANAELKLNGAAPLPVQANNLAFRMDLSGRKLSDFNRLMGVSLPPFGPYRWRGAFGTKKTGVYVKNLDVGVGKSTLGGALNLDTTQKPPMLTIDLVAKSIQIDDFNTKGWSPTKAGSVSGGSDGAKSSLDKETVLRVQKALTELGYDTGGVDGVLGKKSIAAISDYQKSQGMEVTGKPDPQLLSALLGAPGSTISSTQIADTAKPEQGGSASAEGEKGGGKKSIGAPSALLSPATLRRLNGKVTLKVEEVVSGQDQLGQGNMVATLQDGLFTVDPLSIAVPGGSVEIGFGLKPGDNDIALGARAHIKQFDYGILARRLDPESEVGGIMSLEMEFKTQGPSGQLMDTANGHIDFAVLPKDMNAGIFDLWAVNLVTSLMPALDGESDSKLNCIVARFALNDGIMTPTALLIDSTNVQASGDGVINFKNDDIAFKAAPKAKVPQMFSAKTPVQIQGKFTDFKVGLPSGALAGTVIRVVTSPVTTPFQRLFTEKEPPDGRVACKQAWLKPHEVRTGEKK